MTNEMIYMATLLVLPYAAFVFFGETLIPFIKPSGLPQRIRWRYGKKMALVMFLCMVCANVMIFLLGASPITAFAVGGSIFLLSGIYLHKKRVEFVESIT